MSPILLRPIREQFEHSRVIRLLQTRLRRRYAVRVNLGDEREATGVPSGTGLVHPDLVLTSITGARRLHGVVEVETAESVNHLEAMSEWVHLGKVRGAFYLYVPAGATDAARRLCEHYKVAVTEIWSYHEIGDQMRFTMTFRSARAASRAAAAARRAVTSASKTPRQRAGTAKRAVTSTLQATKTAKRTPKAAKRSAATATRAVEAEKRTTTPAKHATGRWSDRPVAKKSVAKAAKATARTTNRATTKMAATKTTTSGKRRASSARKTSIRASTAAAPSASKTIKRSTGAGTKKTAAASSRSRR